MFILYSPAASPIGSLNTPEEARAILAKLPAGCAFFSRREAKRLGYPLP